MWPDLGPEMEAFKRSCYGKPYQDLRDELQKNKSISNEQKREFLDIENSFLYLISYMAGSFDNDGWGQGGEFHVLLTSHMIRLLSDMKVSLADHWNLADTAVKKWCDTRRGNLYRASELLIGTPASDPDAGWGADYWDDCYILLSLLKVRTELKNIDHRLWLKFDSRYKESLQWMNEHVRNGFSKFEKAEWFGPGFHAAGIELLDYLRQQRKFKPDQISTHWIEIQDAELLIESVVESLIPLLNKGTDPGSNFDWDKLFAWHAGQIIVAWKEKRRTAENPEGYESLLRLDPLMEELYEDLQTRQSESGSWVYERGVSRANTNYNTVRALAACYVMEKDKEGGIFASRHIREAHRYLLNETHQAQPFADNPKACVNAIEAFQKLFDFKIPNIHLHLLVSLSYRLHCLGLEKTILGPPRQSGSDLLATVRRKTKEKLEDQGQPAIEPLGVNGRLYDYLINRTEFLGEFNQLNAQKTCDDLRHFLSSSMTEVRSSSAKMLIRELWSRAGLLNFLPLVEHLSDLERDRAFYKFYRDHLNHEVLLFLLGAYIYYENKVLRESIDEEIRSTYKYFRAKPPDDIAAEFLFRWKLIATFHDIGYLFEVDPPDEEFPTKAEKLKERDRLLTRSFEMIDKVRANFLKEYFEQSVTGAAGGNIADEITTLEKNLKKYLPKISNEKDLFTLKTGGQDRNAFKMMDRMLRVLNKAGQIPPDLIENYFHLCLSKPSKRRDEFYDHGVMSALILLKVADIQRFYLQQLYKLSLTDKLRRFPTLQPLVMGERSEDDLSDKRFYIRFAHVAGAIALHNVYPGLHAQTQCHDFDAENKLKGRKSLEHAFHTAAPDAEDRYGISLKENPLAYLTALADVLQDWDRHSFRKTPYEQDDKTPISSSEVLIKCTRDKISVTPLSDLASRRYQTNIKGMQDYILKCDDHVCILPFKRSSERQSC